MGIGDKIQNKAQEVGGKVKEAVGDATDNERLQAEGAADQAGAKVKQAGEAVKDGAKDAAEEAGWGRAQN
ncbi:MAG: CsbD family protein [Micropruina sp.]|uniref:CsbD family protein n=1 Tax=Micropruina sp. TaxID=2737536 RepID=UPI0039E45CC4